MPTILSNNEMLRRAIQHVIQRLNDENLAQNISFEKTNILESKKQIEKIPKHKLMSFIEEAAVNFNLGPKDTESMINTFINNDNNTI